MEVTIHPGHLQGVIQAPVSKSELHRHIIMEMLAGSFAILPKGAPMDCQYTLEGMMKITQREGKINCGDSGSTLRLLLPIAAAVGADVTFTGSKRLLERPLPVPFEIKRTRGGITVPNRIFGGNYTVDCTETSQVLSGMLMALPLCPFDSSITIDGPIVSKTYVGMTFGHLANHDIRVQITENGFFVQGNQKYRSNQERIGGDYSSVSCFLAASRDVQVTGLDPDALQGDKRILSYSNNLPPTIDVTDTPDLVPALVVLAHREGKDLTVTGAGNLNKKESNRLKAIEDIVEALGGNIEVTEDTLQIHPQTLTGGVTVSGYQDHRIIMMTACLATFCLQPVTIEGAEYVRKSYLQFFNDMRTLGISVEEKN